MSTPLPPPVERFATMLWCLSQAVADMSGGNRLTNALIALITDCIRAIEQSFAQIAASIAAGTDAPRGFAQRRKPAVRQPRPPNRLARKVSWKRPKLPEAVPMAPQRERPLREPETAAPAAAQTSSGRSLRSPCRTVRVDPPPMLAPPTPPRARAASPPPLPRPARAVPRRKHAANVTIK